MDYIIISLLVVLIASFGAIFFRKSNSQEKEVENELRLKLARAEQQIVGSQHEKETLVNLLKEENSLLRKELFEERANCVQAQMELEKLQSYFNAQSEKITEQKRELELVKTQMNKDFEIIANKILQEKSDHFTESNHKSLHKILYTLK